MSRIYDTSPYAKAMALRCIKKALEQVEREEPMVKILVYMKSGVTFDYEVAGCTKAREHAHKIINSGYRHLVDGRMEYYPVHEISKVAFDMTEKDYLCKKYEGVDTDITASEGYMLGDR